MPSAINNNPMIRVITLIPVCPSKRTSHGAIRNTPQQQSAKAQWQLKSQANARCCDNASPDDSGANRPAPPLTAALTAQRQCSRVWPSLTFLACFVYLPQLPADHRHCNGDNRIPPAILNESIEIPNSCRMPSPRNKELHKIIATDRFAVRLVLLRAVAVW